MMIDGRYQIEAELGRGAMGRVLQVFDTKLKRRVALKQLNLETEESRRRLANEARAAAKLQSEHVAHVLDAQVDSGGDAYIVMELLTGQDLKALVQDKGRLDPARAADYIAQACDALQEAHGFGIVHRDIKPSNLFLARRHDGTHTIKVLDFGISKANLDEEGTEETAQFTIVGTPRYIAPERLRWDYQADARTDIWGLGIVLYELLVGEAPFAGASGASLVTQIATVDAEEVRARRPEVSPQLNAIVRRCLRRDPKQRYATAAELRTALRAVVQVPPGARGDRSWANAALERAAETTNKVQVLAARLPALPSSRSWFHRGMIAVAVVTLLVIAWRLRPVVDDTMASVTPTNGPVQGAAPWAAQPATRVTGAAPAASSATPAELTRSPSLLEAPPLQEPSPSQASDAARSVESLPLEEPPSRKSGAASQSPPKRTAPSAATRPTGSKRQPQAARPRKSPTQEVKREPRRRNDATHDEARPFPAGSGSELFNDIR